MAHEAGVIGSGHSGMIEAPEENVEVTNSLYIPSCPRANPPIGGTCQELFPRLAKDGMANNYHLWGGAGTENSQHKGAEFPPQKEEVTFLLPSSLNGPPSPSVYQIHFPRQSALGTNPFFNMRDHQNPQRFLFSPTSEPFTPAQTRPSSPVALHTREIYLNRQLEEAYLQINALSENLEMSSIYAREQASVNIELRKYINTLHEVVGGPTQLLDEYFLGEFAILWRSIHNHGKNFYKFSTEANVPAALGDTMKDLLGTEEMVYKMVRDSKTKLMVVAGILVRFVMSRVFTFDFFEKILEASSMDKGDVACLLALRAYSKREMEVVNKVDPAIEKNAAAIADACHKFLLPLMSRPCDKKHIDESSRQLITIIEQASRLWINILGIGSTNWRFSFPPHGDLFINDTMVPCNESNLGLLGEQTKDNRLLQLRNKRVVLGVLPGVERFLADSQGQGKWVAFVKSFVFLD